MCIVLYEYITLYTVYNTKYPYTHHPSYVLCIAIYQHTLFVCMHFTHKMNGPFKASQEQIPPGLFLYGTVEVCYAECRSVKQLQQCCEHSLCVVRASCTTCTPSYTSITLKARQTSYTSECIVCFVHVHIVWCCWLQACMSSACYIFSTVLVGFHAGCRLTSQLFGIKLQFRVWSKTHRCTSAWS